MDIKKDTSGGEKSNSSGKKGNQTIMGILAYLGILIVIPFLTSKNDPFVKFHLKQGLVLLVIEIITWFVGPMFWSLWMLIRVINLAVLVLSIIGIINVSQGREKELPLVGQFSRYFSF